MSKRVYPPVYLYLTQYTPWEETSWFSSIIRGTCPIHTENTPSFDIHLDDGHFYCNGCRESGDIVKIVKIKENLASWETAYRRVEEINARWLPVQTKRASAPAPTIMHLPATEEQRETMTVMAKFWHRLLCHDIGDAARTYLIGRGAAEQTLRDCWQIGYAPAVTPKLSDYIFTYLEKKLGKDRWRQRAIDVGILTERGTILLQDRLIFSCYWPEDWTQIGFYQARILSPSTFLAKFLNPPQLQKLLFSLPIPIPSEDGTPVTESPIGPVVLHQYAIPAIATLGIGTGASQLTRRILDQYGQPFYCCQDADDAGDLQANNFAELCRFFSYPPAHRIRPVKDPGRKEQKGTDEWINRETITPFREAILNTRQASVA